MRLAGLRSRATCSSPSTPGFAMSTTLAPAAPRRSFPTISTPRSPRSRRSSAPARRRGSSPSSARRGRPRPRTSSALCAAVVPTVFPDRARTTRSGCRSPCSGWSRTRRCSSSSWGCAGSARSQSWPPSPDQTSLVTQLGPEHLELVGTLENVVRANAEAVQALPPRRRRVVPAGTTELEPTFATTSTCATSTPAPSSGPTAGGASRSAAPNRYLRLAFDQRHLAENTLAALTAYHALGLPLDRAQQARTGSCSRWRGEQVTLPGGGFVVMPITNPASMRAALLDLAERAGEHWRVAILGEMAELGAESDRYHREIGAWPSCASTRSWPSGRPRANT